MAAKVCCKWRWRWTSHQCAEIVKKQYNFWSSQVLHCCLSCHVYYFIVTMLLLLMSLALMHKKHTIPPLLLMRKYSTGTTTLLIQDNLFIQPSHISSIYCQTIDLWAVLCLFLTGQQRKELVVRPHHSTSLFPLPHSILLQRSSNSFTLSFVAHANFAGLTRPPLSSSRAKCSFTISLTSPW